VITTTWTASTDNVGVTGYNLFRSGVSAGTTVAPVFTFAGLSCGTTYVLGVEAFDAAANTSGRQSITVSTLACPDTSPPSLPAGFAAVDTVWRNSGSLAQPICVHQEIPTLESTALAGKTVALSFYSAALAGLNADNQNQITASIYYGTGSDQGFGTMTASPAITPAWTNIAFSVNQQTVAISTTPTRYSVTGTLPATATEVGVALCFTPTTSTSGGVTDGFAFVGAQLEIAPSPSAYEFHTVQADLAKAQRYFNIVTEPAAGIAVPVVGNSTSGTVSVMTYQFPVTMRAAPTFSALGTALSASTWTNNCGNVNNALATTFIVTKTANSVAGASMTVTSSGSTIGFGCQLLGAGGGSILSWSADF